MDCREASVRLVRVIDAHPRTARADRTDGAAGPVRSDEALEGEHAVPGFRLPLATRFR